MVPTTALGRAFVIFYAPFGLGFLGFTFSKVGDLLVHFKERRRAQLLRNHNISKQGQESSESDVSVRSISGKSLRLRATRRRAKFVMKRFVSSAYSEGLEKEQILQILSNSHIGVVGENAPSMEKDS